MLRFNDGINIDTSGPLRTLHLHDGWYVVGKGMLIPVGSEQKAMDQIESMGEFESSIPMTESSKEEKGGTSFFHQIPKPERFQTSSILTTLISWTL
jgi:hypothetical protein